MSKSYKDKKIMELRDDSNRKTEMLNKMVQEIVRLNSIIDKRKRK